VPSTCKNTQYTFLGSSTSKIWVHREADKALLDGQSIFWMLRRRVRCTLFLSLHLSLYLLLFITVPKKNYTQEKKSTLHVITEDFIIYDYKGRKNAN